MSSAATAAPLPHVTFDEAEHRYAIDGRPVISVTQALQAAGMVDTRHWTEEARLRGQYIHKAIALDAEGALDMSSVDRRLMPYFEAFRAFLAESRVVFEHVEQLVYDAALGYAGTLDAIVRWPNGKRTLIDFKSGAFPPMAGPQTAAYLRCARAWYPPGTSIARAGLQLRADGAYRLMPLNDIVQDEHDFISALRVAQFRERHGIAA